MVHYTFQHMSTIISYHRMDTTLQEYYITDRHKCENTNRYTSMNTIKDFHKLEKETRDTGWGPGRKGLWTVCRRSTLSLRHSGQ